MLFRLGPPPNSLSDAELASGEWQRLARPPLWALNLLSIPIGAVMAFLVLVGWALFTPRFKVSFEPGYQVAVVFLLVVVAGMLLQISTYPGMGLTNHSVFGVWPSRLTPYTVHLSKVSRRHLITSLLLPFVVLALLPLLIASVIRVSSGWLVFASCLSAATFGINVVLAVPAFRLPKGSVVAGRGFKLYWQVR
jgi:hypothetical protein